MNNNIIQRLCLFLFALVLAAPAWSKTDTWSATNRNKNEAEGTRKSNDNVVTVTWSNCKASGAVLKKNRNFKFSSGGTATITCASGWRVRAISFSGDLKNVGNISCSSDGSLYTGNGSTGISCYDAPKQSITIRTNGDCEFVNYTIEYVKEATVEFNPPSLGVHVGERYPTPMKNLVFNPKGLSLSFSIDKTNIAAINGSYFNGVSAGSATLTVKGEANSDYAASSDNITINVLRIDIHPTVSWTSKNMNAWDALDFPEVQGLPADYPGKVNWKSLDESIAKVQNGKIVFGGTGYGKAVKFIAELAQNDKYNANAVSFTVTVNNEMRIFTKVDWENFCNQVNNLNNGGIKATLTANITDPVTTTAGTESYPYSGTFEGDNHSIALNLGGGDYTAPFSVADGATIRNLTVTGSVATSSGRSGSFVGLVQGNTVTIDHCQSSAAITSNRGVFLGGLVGWAETSVKINNCIFSGSMSGANASNCGGLVGWIVTNGKVSSITNCLITAAYSVSANGSNAVAGNAKNAAISKVYILNALGDIPTGAELVSEEQIKNGYVAYQLQNAQKTQTPQVWGQKLNSGNASDKAPVFSTDATKRVWTTTFRENNDNSKVVAVRYCNPGQTPAELTQDEIMAYLKAKASTHYITYGQQQSLSAQGNADRYIDVKFNDQEYLEINNTSAWQTFCDYVNHYSNKVSAKMTSDVTLDASSPMAGNKQRYAGHFDGGGHTLTVNYIGTAQATAPFAQVEGAVIDNLKTVGTIKQTGTTGDNPQSHASGLVGKAFGVTINNCEVAVAISFSLTGNPDQHSGGFVGHGHEKPVRMYNCKFSGSFSAPDGSNTTGIAGLVGWSAGSGSNFTNCYVAGTYTNIMNVYPVIYTPNQISVNSYNNFYCINGINVKTGSNYIFIKAVSSDEAKSGSVTYALQHGTDAKGWSQNLPGDNEPMLVFSGAKTVNKVEFVYNNTVKATRYANTGSTLLGGVPTLKDILGGDYNDSYYYEDFSFNPAFNDESVVSKDAQVKVSLKASEYFTINNRVAWEKFCALVNGGNTKLAAKMTDDVIDAVNTMAGTSANPYQGTFDGQGHSLNVYLSGGQNVAPFSVINGATVKNLSVSGTIAASGKYAGSIVGLVQGNAVTIDHCQSSVVISSSVSGDGTHGGLVGLANAPVNINNCIFSGGISGAATNNCGGLVGWIGNYGKGSKITNCLLTAAYSVNANGSNAVARHSDGSTISKVYILNPFATMPQGAEQVSADQLKNGYVASLLQEGQQQSVWAFRLGGGTMLHAFSHPDESEEIPNYVYYDAWRWRCDYYQLTDNKPYQDSYVKFRADKIAYLRSLKQGKCYTWYQPYTIEYSKDMPFKVYWFTKSSNGNAVFSQLGDGSLLECFTPYLIVMKENRDRIDYGKSTSVNPCPTVLGYVEKGDIKLRGTVKTISNSEASELGAYIMQNDNSWRKVMADQDATAYIPPFRAYLTVDGGAAGAKIGSVLSDGTTTGVENIILKDNDGTTHIYDLRGMDRGTDFDSLPTGVYIRGGKKVVKR